MGSISTAVAVLLLASSAAIAEPVSVIERMPWLPRGETEVAVSVALPTDTFVGSHSPKLEELWLDLDTRRSFGWIEPSLGISVAPVFPSDAAVVFNGDVRAGARVPLTCMSGVRIASRWWLPTLGEQPGGFVFVDRLRVEIEATYDWKLPLRFVTERAWMHDLALFGDVGFAMVHEHYQPLLPMSEPGGAIPAVENDNAGQIVATVGFEAQSSPTFAIRLGARIVPYELATAGFIGGGGGAFASLVSTHAGYDIVATLSTEGRDQTTFGSSELSVGAAARF
jgi:hypothetical protein